MGSDNAGPRVITLRENEQVTNVDLSPNQAAALRDLFNKEGTSGADSTFQPLVVNPSWSGGYDLHAGQHVGVIALPGRNGEGLNIIIEPKVPIANLFHMLTYAHELAHFGSEMAPLVAGESIFDSVARIFVRQVDDIVRRGIHRGYIDRDEQATYLRGRLLVAQQVRRSPVAITFDQRTNEFTADLLENRILQAALALLARVPFNDPDLNRLIRRTLSAFSEVSPVTVRPSDCDRVAYNRLNERYRSPINLARLFLRHLSLEGRSGELPFVTFLLPMYMLFERFVARLLIEQLAATPRLQVEDQWRIWLDEERQLEGRPDLVINRDGRARLVLDTKYKVYGQKPTNADINQMVTYCHTLGVHEGVLLYPGDVESGNKYILKAGVQLETKAISLTGTLGEFRTQWANFVREIIAGHQIVVEDSAS